ncbi:MAG TPA: ABC transporter ATP-binding protein [Acholeplasmataceae bacterium]|nr:ABC transporter ATP-binding protein [Acholeplasmataceae bacterium]
MKMILEINNLTIKYGDKVALNNVSFNLEKGKIIGLLGPNGSGKTTLIKAVNGLLSLNIGKIRINGLNIGVETKAIVSYLPERTYLDLEVKVSEMIKFFSDFYLDFKKEKALELINNLEVPLNKKIKELSKGMREKVQLALVMSREADLYILDEPIAGVDPASREYILATIFNNRKIGSTVIISTHLIYEVENLLDEAVILKEGNLVAHNKIPEIIKGFNSLDEWFRKEFRHV